MTKCFPVNTFLSGQDLSSLDAILNTAPKQRGGIEVVLEM